MAVRTTTIVCFEMVNLNPDERENGLFFVDAAPR